MNTSDFLIANTHININHKELLEDLLKSAKSVKIICPFISINRAKWLAKTIPDDCDAQIITEISKSGIISGIQSPKIHEHLLTNEIKVNFFSSNLHAKVFWIDHEHILITSANLTDNGLENNFEVGAYFCKSKGPKLAEKITFDEIVTRITTLWDDLKVKSTPLTLSQVEEFKELEEKSKEVRKQIEELDFPEFSTAFSPMAKDCLNPSQVDIEIQGSNIFRGFKESDWDAFDHGLEWSPENLEFVKKHLTEKIHPILKNFYENLRLSRNLTINLESFNVGYSHNRWVKNYMPNYRYLWLVRNREGLRKNTHIGEPSFIFGLGKAENGKWFEVRSGIEELNESKLSDFGKAYFRNVLANIDEVISHYHALSGDWNITHENHHDQFPETIKANQISKEILQSLCNEYLRSEKISDIHLRKSYFLEDANDKKTLLSSKIMDSLAEDMKHLNYFFNLAHQ
ncbi:MAG: hypothetical protein GY909_17860 [Oligoflexia bacterium]|nr:hypothetical protein [Oligoflexia bacterium]